MAEASSAGGQAPDELSEHILYQCADQVATITLNRPAKLNAFNDDMVVQLAAALRRFDIDADANVAVIVGNGRAFSSGADVRQRQLRSRKEFEDQGGRGSGWGASAHELLTVSANWKPVITVAHGYAVGMALGLCLQSELIVAEAGAKFQVTEIPRGLAGSRFYALMNFRGAASLAVETSLTGRFFTAEEAFAARLVDRLVPAGEGYRTALDLAAQINRNPPLGVRATVRTRRWDMQKVQMEANYYAQALKLTLTEDFAESARAFAEKRPANPFKGR